MSGSPPLARLLAIAYRALIDGLHDGLRERGWTDVRPAYGFVLLAAREQGTTASDLAALMGVSKQAASKLVDAMAASGYVQRSAGAGDGDARRRPIELTTSGRELLATVESIYAELEAGWAEVVGRDHLERLRADLVAVVTTPDGTLPAVRPTW